MDLAKLIGELGMISSVDQDPKREGMQQAIREILYATGAESLDDVLSAYKEYQGIQEAVSSEAERATQRAQRMEKIADRARAKYIVLLRRHALRDALIDSGIKADRLEFALRVAGRNNVDVELDEEDHRRDAEDMVKKLKRDIPEWFAPAQAQKGD